METAKYLPTEVGIFAADTLVRVAPDTTVGSAARVLDQHDVGAVVVGLESIEGIASERDIVRAIAAGTAPGAATIGEIASRTLVSVDAKATIDEAAELMLERYVRHLLVVDGSEVIGIVSARDLLGGFVIR